MSSSGIIFDLKRYAIHDGPGIRTTVFLKGCPLECWWCHNPEGRKMEIEVMGVKNRRGNDSENARIKRQALGRTVSVDELMIEVKKDTIFYDQSGGGVTFSGGEPMMQIDFLATALDECKKNGIATAVDTCGYAPFEDFEKISGHVDLFLYDLKLMDDEKHMKYTGVSNSLILDNLTRLAKMGQNIIARIPVIPEITDTWENIGAIIDFLTSIDNIEGVSLLPYNKLGEDKRDRFSMEDKLGHLSTPGDDDMIGLAERFEARGFKVKVGG